MASCKNHIIANSSLSWWAAWLSEGEVIAPSEWFTKQYGTAIGYKQEDLIPSKWKTV
jgi:hypothetical protein